MGNYVFILSFALLFTGMGFLIAALNVSRSNPLRPKLRFTGLLVLATTFFTMGVAFIVQTLETHQGPLFALFFFGAALWFGIDTVQKAKQEWSRVKR